jgi:AcrR family transcriptional regulator
MELIDAALDIILSSGIDALRIEDVCERVGVTKGSLYWHFNDREGLVREALFEHLSRMSAQQMAVLDDAIDTAASRDDYLAKVVGSFVDPFDAAEVEHRWQRLELMTTTRRDPDLAALMAQLQQRQQRYLADIMDKAHARGILRTDVDPKAMAAVITAIALGSNHLSLLGDDGPSPEAWTAFMLLMIETLFPSS